ncbi:MAG TPA: hypothetical protein VIV15_02165 [Anaerolineales bacterium]
MKTTKEIDHEPVEIQEYLDSMIEDASLPAGQVLNEPSDQDQRPGLFIP